MLLKIIIFVQLWVLAKLEEDTLVLVHMIFRHCDRTPDTVELYKKSPYYNESYFAPYGFGQLTNEGKQKCYGIGATLRERYNGFLNKSYHYSLVEGRSSDYRRTKESLQLVLAGLFPPTEELMWLEGMNWTPIATFYEKLGQDALLGPSRTPKYSEELVSFKQTKEGQAYEAPFKDMMEYVSGQIDEPIDFAKFGYIVRGLELLDTFNLPIPEEFRNIYPNPLRRVIPEYVSLMLGTKKLKRLYVGYLLSKIFKDTELKIANSLNPQGRKMFIYAAHDLTLAGIFSALDIFDKTIVPVGSYWLLEVHNINGTYGFKFFFHNYTTVEPQLIVFPAFGEFVPLNEFKIKKGEYIELGDLDEPSHSSRLTANAMFAAFLVYCVVQIK